MKGIIDSHAHLSWDSFADDQAQVILSAFKQNVEKIIQAGVDLKTLPEMIKLADLHPEIFFAAGIHPHEAQFWTKEAEEAIRQSAKNKKMVGIGECGLDYHYNHSSRESQILAFRSQIRLAKELSKPLVIHTRQAWEDTFAILKEEGQGQIKGVFHCFTGGPEHLETIRKLDFYISFSGILTFKNAKSIQAAAALAPLDRILVETDCPYLAPEPHRGKRNEPAYVWLVAQKLADLREVLVDDIAQTTADNTRHLFGLPL